MKNEETIEVEPVLRKRPKLVWIISIFYILSAGWTVLSFALIDFFGNKESVPRGFRAFFRMLRNPESDSEIRDPV